MHELSITQNILKLALDTAKENKANKITKINLKIGDFTFVEPECILFYFEQISKNTVAEDAALKIEKIPLKIKCNKCEKESILKDLTLFICSFCKSQDVKIISGRELYIKSIDIN